MGFTRVTPEELERARQDPEWADELIGDRLGSELDVYIDKSFNDIQDMLDAEGVPVQLYMHLDHIDEDGSMSAWTVDDVQAAATHLSGVQFERLARHLPPDKADDGELDYLREHYGNLVRFFVAAAAAEAAAIMSTG